ncbi:MAG: SxtJ family membrane protein [Gammaproteobacteria bacterium]
MSNTHAIPELDRKGLRNFALTTGGIIIGLFGLLLPWLLGRGLPRWPWIVGGVLIVWGLVAPGTLRPVYRAWMRFGLLLNKVTSPLIMALVFFLVITPLGLFRRVSGRGQLSKGRDGSIKSYRLPSKKPEVEDLERPF